MKQPFVFRQHMFTPRPYGSPGFHITYRFILLFFLLLALYFIPFCFSLHTSLHEGTWHWLHVSRTSVPSGHTWPKWHAERFPWHATFTVVVILFYFFAWPEYLHTHTHLTAYRSYINYCCYQIITLHVRKFLHKSGSVKCWMDTYHWVASLKGDGAYMWHWTKRCTVPTIHRCPKRPNENLMSNPFQCRGTCSVIVTETEHIVTLHHESAPATVTNLWTPLPKPEENQMPIESSCHCLKPKCVPVPTILLTQNIIKKNVHNLGLLETITTGCLLPIHQQPANCITSVWEV